MLMKMIPVILIAGAVATYHVGSKGLGKTSSLDSWTMLTWVYGIAFFISLTVATVTKGKLPFPPELKGSLPLIALLAVACIGIEGGYLLAYRSGWKVTELAPVATLANYFLIAAVGVVFFKEGLTSTSIAGLVLVVGGVIVFQWK